MLYCRLHELCFWSWPIETRRGRGRHTSKNTEIPNPVHTMALVGMAGRPDAHADLKTICTGI
jgi:hypothetical protein